MRSSCHSESICQAPILVWLGAEPRLTELKASVLALEDLLVQPREGPRSRLQGVCSQQEVGEGNELTLPGGKGDGIPGRESGNVTPKSESECCRSKRKGILGRQTGRCKDPEVQQCTVYLEKTLVQARISGCLEHLLPVLNMEGRVNLGRWKWDHVVP